MSDPDLIGLDPSIANLSPIPLTNIVTPKALQLLNSRPYDVIR